MIATRFLRRMPALAETRRFAKASRLIHLSRPAQSDSISKLDAQLGLPLFDRNLKQFHLIEAGILLVIPVNEWEISV